MGYFNIFYKITRIIDMLTRKRNRKIIVAILVIIGIIFLLHNKGYCAQEDTTYTTDTSYFIIDEYDKLWDDFLLGFNQFYNLNDTYHSRYNDLFEKINSGKFPYLFWANNETNARLFLYDRNDTFTLVNTSLVYNDYTRIPGTAYNFTWLGGNRFYKMVINPDHASTYLIFEDTAVNDLNFSVPLQLLYKIPSQLYEAMTIAGYTLNNNQDIIDIKTQMNQIKNKIDTTNDKLEGISEDITSTDYNQNVVSVDTSAVDSMSDTEVNGLFSTIVSNFNNALTMWNGTTSIIFYIPFTNGKYISIPDNIVSSKLPTQFLDLVHAFWYFVFGLYLFRFINNLIKKIRSGDILNGYSNDNEVITSNML